MRRSLAQTGGVLAVGLSILWALPAAAGVAFGVVLFVSDRNSDTNDEGFAEFFGGLTAGLGATVLVVAIAGLVLGVKTYRGRGKARVWLASLFLVAAGVSALFLWASISDERGPDTAGILLFGANTAVCLAIVVSGAGARSET